MNITKNKVAILKFKKKLKSGSKFNNKKISTDSKPPIVRNEKDLIAFRKLSLSIPLLSSIKELA